MNRVDFPIRTRRGQIPPLVHGRFAQPLEHSSSFSSSSSPSFSSSSPRLSFDRRQRRSPESSTRVSFSRLAVDPPRRRVSVVIVGRRSIDDDPLSSSASVGECSVDSVSWSEMRNPGARGKGSTAWFRRRRSQVAKQRRRNDSRIVQLSRRSLASDLLRRSSIALIVNVATSLSATVVVSRHREDSAVVADVTIGIGQSAR